MSPLYELLTPAAVMFEAGGRPNTEGLLLPLAGVLRHKLAHGGVDRKAPLRESKSPADGALSLEAIVAEVFKKLATGAPPAAAPAPGPFAALGLGGAPPGHALVAARQLAAAQGGASFNFHLVPEAFLPASLPTLLAGKLDKRELIDFDSAFQTISALSLPSSAAAADTNEAKADSRDSVTPSKGLRMFRDWLVVYTALLHYWSDHQPTDVRDKVSYLKSFTLMVARYGFSSSYDYDKANRSYCARAGAPFAIFKPELWLPPVAEPRAAASRKRKAETSAPAKPSKKASLQKRFHQGKEICFRFNRGICKEPCARAHVCWTCSQEHSMANCHGGAAASAKGKN